MKPLTDEESGIIAMCRLNTLVGREGVQRIVRLWRLEVRYERRFKSNLWGRFGGGWNWKLGIQAGRRTVIVNLLVSSLTFTVRRGDR